MTLTVCRHPSGYNAVRVDIDDNFVGVARVKGFMVRPSGKFGIPNSRTIKMKCLVASVKYNVQTMLGV